MSCRIGVALGSGSARGWAHIGVLRTLDEAGIVPDVVCGTSMGAIVGGLYATGHIAELEEWARNLTKMRMTRYFDFQFGTGGIIAGRRVTEALSKGYRDTRIEALPRSFACVATDLDSGHEVWLRTGSLSEAVRASYAIPGIFPPVPRHDRWLVDGGLVNPLPVSLCRALGAEFIIGVDLRTSRFGAEPGEEDGLEAARAARVRDAAGRGFVRSYLKQRHGGPSAFGVFSRSLSIVQDRIADMRLREDPPELMISPSLRTVAAAEFYRAAECIEAGRDATLRALPEIKKELAGRTARQSASLEKRVAVGGR